MTRSPPERARGAPRTVPADEKAYLARYRPGDYARPAVAVDIVVLTIADAELRVLLVQRGEHPYKGTWALPGGFLRVGPSAAEQGEDLEAAAERELCEETRLEPGMARLEQLGCFGRAGRDPRMRVVSVAYFALVRPDLMPLVRGGGDAGKAAWFSMSALRRLQLAFDHAEIIEAALARIRGELDRSDLVFSLVPQTFTIPELRSVHESITGAPLDPGNFRRKFHRMMQDGLIEQAPGKRITASKPATVYRWRSGRRTGPR